MFGFELAIRSERYCIAVIAMFGVNGRYVEDKIGVYSLLCVTFFLTVFAFRAKATNLPIG